MNLENQRVLVIGLGRSGLAAARLLLTRGAVVTGTDVATRERLSDELDQLPMRLVLGGHAGIDFEEYELVVVSPGVPRLSELEAARQRGLRVIGELELASRFCRAPVVAVGGTNGKSTVTTLIGEILVRSGKRTFVGGNLGTPLSEAVGQDFELLVVEVSSFQLERVESFRPRVAVLLNITDDHLDRYPGFVEYAAAKGNCFVNQTPADLAVVPFGDAVCAAQAARGGARVSRFGSAGEVRVEGRAVLEAATGLRFSLSESRLFGQHNLLNAAAAVAATRELGVEPAAIQETLTSFAPLPHRMAYVASVEGVRYYDDSKGTNVGAAVTALLGLEERAGVLIAGGRDKLGSYAPLVEALRSRGRGLVVLGEAAGAIADAVGTVVPVKWARDMSEAVGLAHELARPSDAVLLSPACSSFDMYSGYAERGERFVQAVMQLALERRSQC